MEGDTFEMEDQRNWTDASYKTYVRPLALPWPYTIAAGDELDQSVTLTVEGSAPAAPAGARRCRVRLGEARGNVPALGLGLDPDDAAAALLKPAPYARSAPRMLSAITIRAGAMVATRSPTAIEAANALGATPWLEAIVAEVEGFEAEDRRARQFGRKSRLAVSRRAGLARLGSEMHAARQSVATLPSGGRSCIAPRVAPFPGAKLGGGMFSYFTELNRKRPPLAELDFVSFTTSALVHAGDDRSVDGGLESLPHIARSVRAIVGDKPFAVGPSAIGMRDNPYGEATGGNPDNIRQAMNRNDPRQRGLLGAAWNLAYFAHFARGGAREIALGGAVGPFGLLHTAADHAQPGFDGAGGFFPVYHVVRGLARLKNRPMRAIEISAPREVQAFAAANELWLSNLMGEPRRVRLGAELAGRLARLDVETFVTAARDADALDRLEQPFKGEEVELNSYAVVRLRLV